MSQSPRPYNPQESAQSEEDPLWAKRRAGETVFGATILMLNVIVLMAVVITAFATDSLWWVAIGCTVFALGVVVATIRWARKFARSQY